MVSRNTAKINLRKLLFKLGIKSAEVTHLEELVTRMTENFGKPDIMMMPGSVIETFMETMYGAKKDDKQESDSDPADPSDPLRDWFSMAPIIRNPGKE